MNNRNGAPSDRRMNQKAAHKMIGRRARQAGIATKVGCHSPRGTGITARLINGGMLDAAQRMVLRPSRRSGDFTLRALSAMLCSALI